MYAGKQVEECGSCGSLADVDASRDELHIKSYYQSLMNLRIRQFLHVYLATNATTTLL